MKNLGLIVLVAVISSLFSVVIYDFIKDEPAEIITVRESAAQYASLPKGTFTEYEGKPIDKTIYYTAAPTNFTKAAALVTNSVVNIKATQGASRSSKNNGWGGLSPGASTGSGVIISSDGYIVTNYHVIEGANDLEVTLYNKRTYEAKIIGKDPSTDLALIKIKKEDLPYLEFGNSDSTSIGEWVLAVGNPFNLTSTVTAGIVSAKGRNINILEGNYKIESFIQTDAVVNPGNSGGALVNTNGALVGINTAIITQSGRYEGYSFAVPSNLVYKIVADLKEFGVVQRGFLGVTIEDVDEKIAKDAGLKKLEGVYISQINPNSAAEDAKLKVGDIITHINDVEVPTMPALQEQVARYRPGDKLTINFIRDGKHMETKIILKDKRNRTTLSSKKKIKEEISLMDDLGVELREISKDEKMLLNIDSGVKVISIRKGSIIDKTDLNPGFVITKVNDKTVKTVDEFLKLIDNTDDKIMLEGVYEDYPGEYYYAFKK
ncbi:MAG: PDZ domain-containing protein [Saprospiraceae bacterium]|nr:PDZ domain-containing protein [Saprospiraceae bacterium]